MPPSLRIRSSCSVGSSGNEFRCIAPEIVFVAFRDADRHDASKGVRTGDKDEAIHFRRVALRSARANWRGAPGFVLDLAMPLNKDIKSLPDERAVFFQ